VSSGTPIDLLRLVQAIRFGPVAASTFAIGLGLLGAGGVLIAIAIWRAAILPRPTGVLLAVPLILLIPQFYLPAWTRIAHGGLLALALIWLAVALWTAAARQDRGSYSDRSSETSFVTSAL
jgi:hypothetical protein